jgi:hypothetical protein
MGDSVPHGVCQIPPGHWQFEPQPEIPVEQSSEGVHAAPRSQITFLTSSSWPASEIDELDELDPPQPVAAKATPIARSQRMGSFSADFVPPARPISTAQTKLRCVASCRHLIDAPRARSMGGGRRAADGAGDTGGGEKHRKKTTVRGQPTREFLGGFDGHDLAVGDPLYRRQSYAMAVYTKGRAS